MGKGNLTPIHLWRDGAVRAKNKARPAAKVPPSPPLGTQRILSAKTFGPDLRPYIAIAPSEVPEPSNQGTKDREHSGAMGSASPHTELDIKPITIREIPDGHSIFGPLKLSDFKSPVYSFNKIKLAPRWRRVLTRFITTPVSNSLAVIATPLRSITDFCAKTITSARSRLEQYLNDLILSPVVNKISTEKLDHRIKITIEKYPQKLLSDKEHSETFNHRFANNFRKISAKFRGQTYVFFVPENDYSILSQKKVEERIKLLFRFGIEAYNKFLELGGKIQKGKKIEVVIGNCRGSFCREGRVFLGDTRFDMGTDSIKNNERIIKHEIGHALLLLSLNEGLNTALFTALDEGVANYAANTQNLAVGREKKGVFILDLPKWQITAQQARNARGLTQLDVEESMGGNTGFRAGANKLYRGATVHQFGLEFIRAFIVFFPSRELIPFLRKISEAENTQQPDFGTSLVRRKLREHFLKTPQIEDKIMAFEKRLLERLIKEQRVFCTEEQAEYSEPLPDSRQAS